MAIAQRGRLSVLKTADVRESKKVTISFYGVGVFVKQLSLDLLPGQMVIGWHKSRCIIEPEVSSHPGKSETGKLFSICIFKWGRPWPSTGVGEMLSLSRRLLCLAGSYWSYTPHKRLGPEASGQWSCKQGRLFFAPGPQCKHWATNETRIVVPRVLPFAETREVYEKPFKLIASNSARYHHSRFWIGADDLCL